jgi:hypothetical protein
MQLKKLYEKLLDLVFKLMQEHHVSNVVLRKDKVRASSGSFYCVWTLLQEFFTTQNRV